MEIKVATPAKIANIAPTAVQAVAVAACALHHPLQLPTVQLKRPPAKRLPAAVQVPNAKGSLKKGNNVSAW
ncbi:MAG: hypothetical protein EOO88_26710 [Pedobacter sp.]|nr:MAG: hypothetical protein EOO88_26710 [Pedobacter sp.]